MTSKKLTKSFLVLILFIAHFSTVFAQQDCEVSVSLLKGSYLGDCKGGKANGKGKAIGKDSYEGTFINGYPDGAGIYRYHNGDFYSGSFSKGLMQGKGEFHYVILNKEDSIVKGVWVDNIHKDYDKDYVIISKTSAIVKLNIKEIKGDATNRVIIESKPLVKSAYLSTMQTSKNESNGSPGSGYRDPGYDLNSNKFSPLVTPVSNYIVSQGVFLNVFNQKTDKEATTEFQQVTFPFKTVVYFNDDYVEFWINKPSSWKLDVTIAKER